MAFILNLFKLGLTICLSTMFVTRQIFVLCDICNNNNNSISAMNVVNVPHLLIRILNKKRHFTKLYSTFLKSFPQCC